MNRRARWRRWLLGGLLGGLLGAGEAAADGSWVANVPGLRVAMAEREVVSRPLVAPAELAAGRVTTLAWQYRSEPAAALRARLCHAEGCVALPGPRGTSQALAGLPASTALHFRFALAPGQRGAVTVHGLQVIVNTLSVSQGS